MANATKELKDAQFSNLFSRKRCKNSYQPLEAGAYPRMFLRQLEEAAHAVLTGDLSKTKMVRLDMRSNRYLVSIGFGAKHTGLKNDYIPKGEFAAYGSLAEALEGIQALYSLARQGAFDERLEELREKRQKHAEKMLSRRKKAEGFMPPAEVIRRNAILPEEQLPLAA